MRIAVLHGAVPPEAPPDEQDVLVEAEVVSSSLRNQGHTVEHIEFSLALPEVRKEDTPFLSGARV